MKILNTEKEDYHIHSLNFSDGWNTVDDIVKFAGDIGMKKIVICDHSQASLDFDKFPRKVYRDSIERWKNVFNNVEVLFGVEADLLNDNGDICSNINGVEGNFIILSYHSGVFKGEKKRVAKGFIKAIERFHERINIIGHICEGLDESDAAEVIEAANKHKIPLEINAQYFLMKPDSWNILLEKADRVYINSDGHFLNEILNNRKEVLKILRKDKWI